MCSLLLGVHRTTLRELNIYISGKSAKQFAKYFPLSTLRIARLTFVFFSSFSSCVCVCVHEPLLSVFSPIHHIQYLWSARIDIGVADWNTIWTWNAIHTSFNLWEKPLASNNIYREVCSSWHLLLATLQIGMIFCFVALVLLHCIALAERGRQRVNAPWE